MSRSRHYRNDEGDEIEFANGREIVLGETFHKADMPWIVWSVTRINMNIEPTHVELTMLKDSKTRITVSIDALTSQRYFSPSGDGGSIFPPIRKGGTAPRKWRPQLSMKGRTRLREGH